jgi:hypothetical protein
LVKVAVFTALVCPTLSLPNARLAGLIARGKSPVPDSPTVCGESGALSLIASDPVSDPATAGVNVTFTVHDAPAAIDDPQVLLATAKFPVAAIELTLTAAELVFFNVTDFAAAVVFTSCGLKARLSGVGVTIGLLATVKGKAAKAAQLAPLGKLSTHTWNAPGFAICAAVTGTLSCVLFTNVTAGKAPSTETTELALNPVPFSRSVKFGPPGTAAAGLRLVKVSGVELVL